jgi:FkbM family methyltransferase
MTFEPVASTYEALRKNIEINQVASLVDARCMAIGSEPGHLTLTGDQDTQNHVVAGSKDGRNDNDVVIETNTLDNVLAGKAPQLLKVDVEGWEQEVGGKLEFIPDTKVVIEKTIEHITRKRKALGITEYAKGKFGAQKVLMDMTDRRKLEDEQKKAAASK